MKYQALSLLSFLFILFSSVLGQGQTYLATQAPGLAPEVFAPGVVSLKDTIDFAAAFSPSGDEFYFSRMDVRARTCRILVTRKDYGSWSTPLPVAFTSTHRDSEPFITPDGKRLFFTSSRPLPGQQEPQQGNIWVVDKLKNAWSAPKPLGSGINTPALEGHPTLSSDGVMYFHRRGQDFYDIFRSKPTDGQYLKAEKLGPAINTSDHIEGEPYISPTQDYLIFISAGREDRVAENPQLCDLYISFRDEKGKWTQASSLGDKILSKGEENWPRMTPDGRYLFFSSNRDKKTPFPDIFWVDAQIIYNLRSKALGPHK